jgi:hypothetical protein
MYAVYRASGRKSNLAYYGYASDVQSARESFLGGAKRPELSRADVRLLAANDGDPDNIVVDIVDVAPDEITAWTLRNDLRASSVDSISGPTMFPGNIAERAAKDHPEKFADWKAKIKMRQCPTARDAYALGMWTPAQISDLAKKHSRTLVIESLDKMTPDQFAVEFFL